MNRADLITNRPGKPEDEAFIFSTWLNGLRFGNDWFELIEQDAYYEAYHRVIEMILRDKSTIITVACMKDDEDTIVGYAVHNLLGGFHWVHVKKAWRGIGIARSLKPAAVDYVTHVNKVGRILMKKYPKVTFNPFRIP